MIKTMDIDGELVFKIGGASVFKPCGEIVRISPEAQNIIDEIRAETGMSAASVASELIKFAGAHYSIKKW